MISAIQTFYEQLVNNVGTYVPIIWAHHNGETIKSKGVLNFGLYEQSIKSWPLHITDSYCQPFSLFISSG